MHRLVEQDLPIVRRKISYTDAVEDFTSKVESHRVEHNRSAAQLFDNWLELVY